MKSSTMLNGTLVSTLSIYLFCLQKRAASPYKPWLEGLDFDKPVFANRLLVEGCQPFRHQDTIVIS